MCICTQQPLHRGLMMGRVRQVGKSRPHISQESALWSIQGQAQAIPYDVSDGVLPRGSQVLLDGIAHVAALLDTFTVMTQIIIAPGGVEEDNEGFRKQPVRRR